MESPIEFPWGLAHVISCDPSSPCNHTCPECVCAFLPDQPSTLVCIVQTQTPPFLYPLIFLPFCWWWKNASNRSSLVGSIWEWETPFLVGQRNSINILNSSVGNPWVCALKPAGGFLYLNTMTVVNKCYFKKHFWKALLKSNGNEQWNMHLSSTKQCSSVSSFSSFSAATSYYSCVFPHTFVGTSSSTI